MRKSEIEAWALNVVDRVCQGVRIEDSRVELKANWIEHEKAARRIAGHANSARGERVLWIFGLDEEAASIVGVDPDDFAEWWDKTKSHFAGPTPRAEEVNLFVGTKRLVAALFETDSTPYLVRNPAYGKQGGGPVELEVPWREMTKVRSARHSDLIRLLVPQLHLPEVEVLTGYLSGRGRLDETGASVLSPGPDFKWDLSLVLYFFTRTRDLVVFPAHRCKVFVSEPESLGDEVSFTPYQKIPSSKLVYDTFDIRLEGPRRFEFGAICKLNQTKTPGRSAKAVVHLSPAGSEQAIQIHCEFRRPSDNDWHFKLRSAHVTVIGAQALRTIVEMD